MEGNEADHVRFLCVRKDGGPDSTVWGYWLIESKRLFSIALLRFKGLSREAFHTHAFDCLGWVIRGHLRETMLDGTVREYHPSWKPFPIFRGDFHKVDSLVPNTWVFTIRGPWAPDWKEYHPSTGLFWTLTNGRKMICAGSGR